MADTPAYNEGSISGAMGSLFKLGDGKPALPTASPTNKVETAAGGIEPTNFIAVGPSVLFANTDEVTLDSEYYPNQEPFSPRLWVRVPDSITGKDEKIKPVYNEATEFALSRPNIYVNFSLEEITDGIGSFSLTLYDQSWHKIEDKILKSKGHLRVIFGHDNDQPISTNKLLSPWYDCLVTNYSVKFGMEGVTLFLTGLTTGYTLNMVQVFSVFADNTSISDIVKKIAAAAGFEKVVIEPTKKIYTREQLEKSEQGQKIFRQEGQTSLVFIVECLKDFAISEQDGKAGDYKFFIRNTRNGPELHYHTAYYDPSTSSSSLSVPAFTLHKSRNSPVMNFEPLWDMAIIQLRGAGDTFSAIIDANTKATIPYSTDTDAVPQKYDNKAGIIKFKPANFNTEKKEIKTFRRELIPQIYQDEQVALLNTKLSRRRQGALQAMLTVQGTTAFNLLDKIAVIVYVPQQDISLKRNIHWVSGYYRIVGIKHQISAGSYTTTFTLFTDGRSNELLEMGAVSPAKNSNK